MPSVRRKAGKKEEGDRGAGDGEEQKECEIEEKFKTNINTLETSPNCAFLSTGSASILVVSTQQCPRAPVFTTMDPI